jgi:hypothetical protein
VIYREGKSMLLTFSKMPYIQSFIKDALSLRCVLHMDQNRHKFLPLGGGGGLAF